MAYANGKIYALRTYHSEEVYIGSTIRTLEERFSQHKCKNNKTISKSLFEKYDDVFIVLIELFPCENKAELFRREGEILRGFGDKAVNKNIAGQTKKERSLKYRDKTNERKKEKYVENQVTRREYADNYRAKNQEKINAKQRERREKEKAEAAV